MKSPFVCALFAFEDAASSSLPHATSAAMRGWRRERVPFRACGHDDGAACHTPGGAADQRGAKLEMYRDTYPDFVSANLELLRDYVKLDYDGKPLSSATRSASGATAADRS